MASIFDLTYQQSKLSKLHKKFLKTTELKFLKNKCTFV